MPLTDPALIDGLLTKRYTVPQLWAAKLAGRTQELLRDVNDPKLADVVRAYIMGVKDRRYRNGLEALLRLAPAGACLSYLSLPADPVRVGGEAGAKHIAAMMNTLRQEG